MRIAEFVQYSSRINMRIGSLGRAMPREISLTWTIQVSPFSHHLWHLALASTLLDCFPADNQTRDDPFHTLIFDFGLRSEPLSVWFQLLWTQNPFLLSGK